MAGYGNGQKLNRDILDLAIDVGAPRTDIPTEMVPGSFEYFLQNRNGRIWDLYTFYARVLNLEPTPTQLVQKIYKMEI